MIDEKKLISQVSNLIGIHYQELRLEYLKNYIEIDDATKKATVYHKKTPVAFVLISSESYPDTLLNNFHKAAAVGRLIGERSARHLLIPDIVDVSNGISYTNTKYYRQFKANFFLKFLQKRVVGALIVLWLIQVLKDTQRKLTERELRDKYVLPLQQLKQQLATNHVHRMLIDEALGALKDGTWQPRVACTHNDLWSGNVLVDGLFDFKIIDWGGALLEGYPFYDFIRICHSFQLHRKMIAHLFKSYSRVIECENVSQAKYYLLAYFAYQSKNLGQWSHEKCMETLTLSIEYAEQSLG